MKMARSIVGVILVSVVLFGITSGRDLVWLALPRSAQYRLCLRDAAPILAPRVAHELEKDEQFRLSLVPKGLNTEQMGKVMDALPKASGNAEKDLVEACWFVAFGQLQNYLDERERAREELESARKADAPK